MFHKVRFQNVILKLTLSLAFSGCFFISKSMSVQAAEASPVLVINPAAAQTPAVNPATTPVLIPAATYVATENTHSLAIVLPERLDVGNESFNLQKMTGYRVYAYKDSTEIYNSGNAYNDAGTGIIDLEALVRALSLQLNNVSENLRFKVIYIGKNASGEYKEAKDVLGNTLEWTSDILSVYRVSIGGENVNPAFTYGFSGQTIVLIPSVAQNYSFKQWADGSLQNPRIVTVSTNNSENTYTALAALPDVIVSQNADGGYDVIPQTGEGNSTFWLICLSVFGMLGTGYVLFSMVLVPMNKMSSGKYDDF